jgi:hypothetical protein
MTVYPIIGTIQPAFSVLPNVNPKVTGTSPRILPYCLDSERL